MSYGGNGMRKIVVMLRVTYQSSCRFQYNPQLKYNRLINLKEGENLLTSKAEEYSAKVLLFRALSAKEDICIIYIYVCTTSLV